MTYDVSPANRHIPFRCYRYTGAQVRGFVGGGGGVPPPAWGSARVIDSLRRINPAPIYRFSARKATDSASRSVVPSRSGTTEWSYALSLATSAVPGAIRPESMYSRHFPVSACSRGGGDTISAYSRASSRWSSFFTRSSGRSLSTRDAGRYRAPVIESIKPAHLRQITNAGPVPSRLTRREASNWASRWSRTPCLLPLSQGEMKIPCREYSYMYDPDAPLARPAGSPTAIISRRPNRSLICLTFLACSDGSSSATP